MQQTGIATGNSSIDIFSNTVNQAASDGILVADAIANPNVGFLGLGNNVTSSGANGIRVQNVTGSVDIDDNTVRFSGNSGIRAANLLGDAAPGLTILSLFSNDIAFSALDGIELANIGRPRGPNGVDGDDLDVSNNTITAFGRNGLGITHNSGGDIRIVGNMFASALNNVASINIANDVQTAVADIRNNADNLTGANASSVRAFAPVFLRFDPDVRVLTTTAGNAFSRFNFGDIVYPTPGTATPATAFNITPVFGSAFAVDELDVIRRAIARWEQVVVTDVPNVGAIDDIQITFRLLTDAPGGILAVTATGGQYNNVIPLANGGTINNTGLRAGTALPSMSDIVIDQADLGRADLCDIVTHEIGHAIGFSRFVWTTRGGLTQNLDTVNAVFTGPRAVNEYNSRFGLAVAGVPLDLNAGVTTSHWPTAWPGMVAGDELMEPAVGVPFSRMSRITIGHFEDLYGIGQVDYRQAEQF